MVRSHCPTPTPTQRATPTQIMINSIQPIFVGLCISLFVGSVNTPLHRAKAVVLLMRTLDVVLIFSGGEDQNV